MVLHIITYRCQRPRRDVVLHENTYRKSYFMTYLPHIYTTTLFISAYIVHI
ncbi:Calcium uniporter, mitochondrial [Gossypium arboreum]|uniref:Calcium uniporter, mitochondrial n=1 Tax=Gossypium arboreum TaxID=29729 RepID=A0A0B0MA05_GOSAR|nr:Calcium uniporter, mitochondrial [Gossypium arboreum]